MSKNLTKNESSKYKSLLWILLIQLFFIGCLGGQKRYSIEQNLTISSAEMPISPLKIDNEPTYLLKIRLDNNHDSIYFSFKTWFAKESIFQEKQYCKTWITLSREVKEPSTGQAVHIPLARNYDNGWQTSSEIILNSNPSVPWGKLEPGYYILSISIMRNVPFTLELTIGSQLPIVIQ